MKCSCFQTLRKIVLISSLCSGAGFAECILSACSSLPFSKFLSADKTRKCGQYLGMRDGFIEDFQIWSPSESPNYPATAGRPGASGWRPSKYDMETPFIQVYFLLFLWQHQGKHSYTFDMFSVLEKDFRCSLLLVLNII